MTLAVKVALSLKPTNQPANAFNLDQSKILSFGKGLVTARQKKKKNGLSQTERVGRQQFQMWLK